MLFRRNGKIRADNGEVQASERKETRIKIQWQSSRDRDPERRVAEKILKSKFLATILRRKTENLNPLADLKEDTTNDLSIGEPEPEPQRTISVLVISIGEPESEPQRTEYRKPFRGPDAIVTTWQVMVKRKPTIVYRMTKNIRSLPGICYPWWWKKYYQSFIPNKQAPSNKLFKKGKDWKLTMASR